MEVTVLKAYKEVLEQGKNARIVDFESKEEQDCARNLFLLTAKPVLYVCNVGEADAKSGNDFTKKVEALAKEEGAESMVIAAKTEEDIAELESYEDKQLFLEELGLETFNPVALGTYIWETERDSEFVFVHAIVGHPTLRPNAAEVSEGRWWSFEELEEAMGKNILTPNFESEFARIKDQLLAML